MGEFPNEVIEIHPRFLADFSELHDHAFARIDAANDTFDVERFGQANLREKFGTRPELLVRFQIHSRRADVAERGVQSDFTPDYFDVRLAGVTRVSATLGFAHSGRPFKKTVAASSRRQSDAMQARVTCQRLSEDDARRERIVRGARRSIIRA